MILYVHGRALPIKRLKLSDTEPEKSQNSVIPELESRYNAAVLMLHWPHRGLFTAFPTQDAQAAGPALDATIKQIAKQFEKSSPPLPMVLLTHSMGSIVLEERINKSGTEGFNHFGTIMISAPASDSSSSKVWLEKLPAGKGFVTFNDGDGGLFGDMLGNLSAAKLKTKALAPNVFYLDISALDLGHRAFIFGKELSPGERLLCEKFYKATLSGRAPDPGFFKVIEPGLPMYDPIQP